MQAEQPNIATQWDKEMKAKAGAKPPKVHKSKVRSEAKKALGGRY